MTSPVRLSYKVVSSRIKKPDAFHYASLPRHHDNRRRIRSLPDATEDVFTATVRQHIVEKDTSERARKH
ncbi:conserved hypothetical protein (plasmid) [Rhizobium johnstonii 3841]|uniref:Uncharacterized protein n=1 Tax=Rhizobium johnstonii (strain DSM 114642 / LMG 32736 / 3841) TaxID=216596 RepID=Q1M9U7_RHIJ3|nr:conserved hypothetical protein [Rhizobium johnstonii 3841]